MKHYTARAIYALREAIGAELDDVRGADRYIAIEEMTRTHMMAGHTAEDIIRDRQITQTAKRFAPDDALGRYR